MTITVDDLNLRHQDLLEQTRDQVNENTLTTIQNFLVELSHAGKLVSKPRQRSKLRGLIRFWSSFIYEQIGEFPSVQLFPADEEVDDIMLPGHQPEMSFEDMVFFRLINLFQDKGSWSKISDYFAQTEYLDSSGDIAVLAKVIETLSGLMDDNLDNDLASEIDRLKQREINAVSADDKTIFRIAGRFLEFMEGLGEFGDNVADIRSGEYKPVQHIFKPRDLFGPYEILEEVGEGGFSVVYKAVDRQTDQIVALKILRDKQFRQSHKFRERLLKQEEMIAKLNHPNIVPIYSVSEMDGIPYIAMKFIESGSLSDRLAQWFWRPSIRQILEIVQQTAKSLAYLHDLNIVHRDIKPANLLLSFENHVYLTDFGIAQVFESAFKGMIVGTPEYLAPEAILEPENVDGRVDLYALGIIFFQLLTGVLPFHANTSEEVLHLQVNKPIPLLSNMPDEIAEIINKCLAKKVDDRFRSADGLALKLEMLLETLDESILDSSPTNFTASPEQREETPITKQFLPLDMELECSACHQTLKPGAAFCDNCGAPARQAQLPSPVFQAPAYGPTKRTSCPNCGTPLSPDEVFCGNCGTPAHPTSPPLAKSYDNEGDTLILNGAFSRPHQDFLAILIVQSGRLDQEYFLVRSICTTIGRSKHNNIVMNENSISRQHALLVYEEKDKSGVFKLFDLASANGIYVDSKKVHIMRYIDHNDSIKLGNIKLRLKRLDDKPMQTESLSENSPDQPEQREERFDKFCENCGYQVANSIAVCHMCGCDRFEM
ncbi:MAG: protein kinase [Anaerolinea sp.]|nr:protein kinase [Anaerolinea sp.]